MLLLLSQLLTLLLLLDTTLPDVSAHCVLLSLLDVLVVLFEGVVVVAVDKQVARSLVQRSVEDRARCGKP